MMNEPLETSDTAVRNVKPRRNRFKSAIIVIGDFFYAFAVTVAILFFLLVVGIPLAMGAKPNVILTNSMFPLISPGDVVMIKDARASDVRIGDIVKYQEKSGSADTITHRLIGMNVRGSSKEDYTFLLRGDNNNGTVDPIVKAGQIQGVIISYPWNDQPYIIPKIGWVKNYPLQTGSALLLMFAIIIAANVLSKDSKNSPSTDVETKEKVEKLDGDIQEIKEALTAIAGDIRKERAEEGPTHEEN